MRIAPKKSLGQNFLVDKNIQSKIIGACEIGSSETILEIGSGRGEMTDVLAAHGSAVYALEIDSRLIMVLRQKYKNSPRVRILHQDILRFDISRFCLMQSIGSLKVIGNIPYYITTPIIEHLLKHRSCIETAYLSVQKEFGRRIVAVAGSKEYGSFSCFVSYYVKPEILFTIPRSCFYPKPKVDSCLLKLTPRPKPPFEVKDVNYLFSVIRAAFAQRRKMLKNALREIVPETVMDEFFDRYRMSPAVRPERLSLEDFAHLADMR